MEFCHITPTPHLDLVTGRPVHLVLAHLLEQDSDYLNFYKKEKENGSVIIVDNSGFELFKLGMPMFPSEKLIDLALAVGGDYLVMTDYPGENVNKTIESAKQLAPMFKRAGIGTFFVPQGQPGDVEQVLKGFRWAADNPDLIDYIGVSILTAPIMFDCESGNKLQRFVSRYMLLDMLERSGIFQSIINNKQKIHLLGMVDGPNEIKLVQQFKQYINTWDSSAAVWAGLNQIIFDSSATGLVNGKFERHVDFSFYTANLAAINMARINMEYIDNLCVTYLGE